MNRENFNLLSCYRGISNIDIDVIDCPDYITPDSDFDRILRQIFTVNEKTGLPEGDIAYFLSPNGNPQIKEWLTNNLLKPRSVSVGSSIEGVTDDLIVEFMPQIGEDKYSFAQRLDTIRQEAIKNSESNKD